MKDDQKALYRRLFSGCNKQDFLDFCDWVNENPSVFFEFRRLAQEYKNAGNKKCSHWLIANIIRWNSDIKLGSGKFKIKNLHIAYLARLLILKEPSFDGFFCLARWRS